jgi:hypothetical protein
VGFDRDLEVIPVVWPPVIILPEPIIIKGPIIIKQEPTEYCMLEEFFKTNPNGICGIACPCSKCSTWCVSY